MPRARYCASGANRKQVIERTINEAGNVELLRRDPSYVRVPSGEIAGEEIVFVNSISHAQWLWPSGIPDPLPEGWPYPLNAEIPDYVEQVTP